MSANKKQYDTWLKFQTHDFVSPGLRLTLKLFNLRRPISSVTSLICKIGIVVVPDACWMFVVSTQFCAWISCGDIPALCHKMDFTLFSVWLSLEHIIYVTILSLYSLLNWIFTNYCLLNISYLTLEIILLILNHLMLNHYSQFINMKIKNQWLS